MSDAQLKHIDEVVEAHANDKWPDVHPAYLPAIKRMFRLYDDSYKIGSKWVAEQEINAFYTTGHGRTVKIRGKIDGLCEDQGIIAEHKCKGKIDGDQARSETPVDLQVNLYCYMQGCNEIIYDLIRIPSEEAQFYIPKRRTGEKWNNWADRIFYREVGKQDYPIEKVRHRWLDQFPVYLTPESLKEYVEFQIDPLIEKLCVYWDYVTSANFDPNDPKCYNEIFYKKPVRAFDPSRTEKFKCNYHAFLCGEQDLDDLRKAEFYAELSGEE